jgi:hypothetical protein
MDTLVGTLVVCQALGALVGTVSAVWGELAYVKAMRDNAIDTAERAHLDTLAHGLWVGMSILLSASLALVVLAFVQDATLQPALTPVYWSFMSLALLVTLLVWALSRRRVSFPLGSAAILTAWWMLLYMALGRFPELGFGAVIATYVVATALMYAVLQYARFLAWRGEASGGAAA